MAFRICIALVLLGIYPGRAEAPPADEYRVKAAFVFNFTKFVEWPSGVFKTPVDPISICVFGNNPFGSALEQTVEIGRAHV